MKNKRLYQTFLLLSLSTFTASAQIAERIDSIYITYGRPALVSLCVLFVVVGGVMNMSDIRAGGEQAKKAAGSWGMMVLWPVIIFAVAEIAKSLFV